MYFKRLLKVKLLRVGTAVFLLFVLVSTLLFFNPLSVKGVLMRMVLLNRGIESISMASEGSFHTPEPISLKALSLLRPIEKIDFRVNGQFESQGEPGQQKSLIAVNSEIDANGIGLKVDVYSDSEKLIVKLPFISNYNVVNWEEARSFLKTEFDVSDMSPEMRRDLEALTNLLQPKLLERMEAAITKEELTIVGAYSIRVGSETTNSKAIVFKVSDALVAAFRKALKEIVVDEPLVEAFVTKHLSTRDLSIEEIVNNLLPWEEISSQSEPITLALSYNWRFKPIAFQLKSDQFKLAMHLNRPITPVVVPVITKENSVDLLKNLAFLENFQ